MSGSQVLAELGAWSGLELTAVALALAYLVLAARQSLWCWPCAIVSSSLYLYLFIDRQLYQQGLLQIFYVVMAVYGYWNWRQGGRGGQTAPVRTWKPRTHLVAIAAVAVLTAATGWVEARFTAAQFPYLDAFTTWGAVITTWMVTRKILENWLYWLVVDGVSVHLYWSSGLPATAILFVVYLAIVVAGYIGWRRTLQISPA